MLETTALETTPRTLNREDFHNPALARKGDKWHNPSVGQKDLLTVEYVTKYVSYTYAETWYVVVFTNGYAIRIGEGLGMGTFYKLVKPFELIDPKLVR